MASNRGLTITRQSSVTSDDITTMQPRIPPLHDWLNYVERMLAPKDISILKLCLYPTLNRSKLDNADMVPDVFHNMVDSDDPNSQQTVLCKFVCALRVVGNERSDDCIAELGRKGIDIPEIEDREESNSTNFRFFQCFARVARDIESDENALKTVRKACGRRLKTNHRRYVHLADMFMEVYEAQLVVPADCDEFCRILRRCKNGANYIKTMTSYKHKTTQGIFNSVKTSI